MTRKQKEAREEAKQVHGESEGNGERQNSRLLPPLVVYQEMWADAREFRVGFVPHLGFQDLGFIDERSVIA